MFSGTHFVFSLVLLLSLVTIGSVGAQPAGQHDIIEAVVSNDMGRLEWLISEGVDPDYYDVRGDRWTPLIHAVSKGNFDMADRLLRAHANPNQAEKDGWTPVHFAAAFGHAIIARSLIEAGGDITIATASGVTPVDIAKEYGKFEVMEVFEMAQRSNIKPLAAAAAYRMNHPRFGSNEQRTGGGAQVVQPPRNAASNTMAAMSTDAVRRKNDLKAFFETAANGPNPLFFELIKDKRVDINAKSDGDLRTALHRAAESDSLTRVQQLVTHGAYVNEVDANQWTALMFAAAKARADIVRYLVMEGADPFARNSHGIAAHVLAAENGHPEISSLITSFGLKNALHVADERHILQMINAGADPDTAGPSGFTALLYFASRGIYDQVRDMLRLGCDPNLAENEGWTALHFASFQGNVQNVVLLMNNGADPTRKNNKGMTPMQQAQAEGHQAVIDILNSYKPRNLRSGPTKWAAPSDHSGL